MLKTNSNITKIVIGSFQELTGYVSKHLVKKPDSDYEDLGAYIEKVAPNATKQNILFVYPEKNKKDINVEQIEEIIKFAEQKPHLSSESHVFIFSSERLSSAVQNKLLKLLEEPPVYLHIHLLCNKSQGGDRELLQTVKSRCEIVHLSLDDRGEDMAELTSIAKQFFGNEASKTRAYETLQEMMKQKKENSEVQQLLSDLLKIMAKHCTSLDDLKIINDLNRGIRANVNAKLILDKLFVDFVV